MLEDGIHLLRRRSDGLLASAKVVQQLLDRLSAIFRRDPAAAFVHVVVVRVEAALTKEGVHRR